MSPSPSIVPSPPKPPPPLGTDVLAHWVLDPSISFLNHGCFGATPRAVLEAQTAWRQRLEARPVELLDRGRDALVAPAKERVGRFLGASPDNFGFVTNATGGVNAVLRSLALEAGDEIVTTNHVYPAIRKTMRFVAGRAGADYVEVDLPLPLKSPDDVLDAVTAALGPRTRVLVIDSISSETAVVFPVERLLDAAKAHGVDVIIDGAHAPGQLELDLDTLGAAYFTGNLHKWVCAPKGAAILWVRPDRQAGIHPNTISHFVDEGLAREFSWQGTRDITPWLCAAESIEYLDRTFGWPQLRRHNHDLAVWVQDLLCRRWGVEPSTPSDGSMLGSMVTVALPPEAAQAFDTIHELHAQLYEGYRIEVPVIDWNRRWWVRASCQAYNTPQQYEQLAGAVTELLRRSGG